MTGHITRTKPFIDPTHRNSIVRLHTVLVYRLQMGLVLGVLHDRFIRHLKTSVHQHHHVCRTFVFEWSLPLYSSQPVLTLCRPPLSCRDALIIATGSRPALDPLGPFNVDYQGTVNLIEAAKAAGVKKVTEIAPSPPPLPRVLPSPVSRFLC